jgi:hypothetical protein
MRILPSRSYGRLHYPFPLRKQQEIRARAIACTIKFQYA